MIKWYELKSLKPAIVKPKFMVKSTFIPMLYKTKFSEKLYWVKKLGIKNCIKLWMFEKKVLKEV